MTAEAAPWPIATLWQRDRLLIREARNPDKKGCREINEPPIVAAFYKLSFLSLFEIRSGYSETLRENFDFQLCRLAHHPQANARVLRGIKELIMRRFPPRSLERL
jgi:hypothetical protein